MAFLWSFRPILRVLPKAGVRAGMRTSVYIKALIPEKMKVKLSVLEVFESGGAPVPMKYFIGEDITHIDEWRYSPACSDRISETVFGGPDTFTGNDR